MWAWLNQVLDAISRDGLATVEVVFLGALTVMALRAIRAGVAAVWEWFKPLGAEVLGKVGGWFEEMTSSQKENTAALHSHALAAQSQAAATAELTQQIRAADRTKTIDQMADQVVEIHQVVVGREPPGKEAA